MTLFDDETQQRVIDYRRRTSRNLRVRIGTSPDLAGRSTDTHVGPLKRLPRLQFASRPAAPYGGPQLAVRPRPGERLRRTARFPRVEARAAGGSRRATSVTERSAFAVFMAKAFAFACSCDLGETPAIRCRIVGLPHGGSLGTRRNDLSGRTTDALVDTSDHRPSDGVRRTAAPNFGDLPYLALVVVAHLVLALLLPVVMRRARVVRGSRRQRHPRSYCSAPATPTFASRVPIGLSPSGRFSLGLVTCLLPITTGRSAGRQRVRPSGRTRGASCAQVSVWRWSEPWAWHGRMRKR